MDQFLSKTKQKEDVGQSQINCTNKYMEYFNIIWFFHSWNILEHNKENNSKSIFYPCLNYYFSSLKKAGGA